MRFILGIDISKRDFHAALLDGDRVKVNVFANEPKGFKALAAWQKKSRVSTIHACMEATGSYWEKLALFLYESDQDVSVINPSQTKAFASSELLRVKTDRVDAALIARFCRSNTPALWIPPLPEVRELQRLVRRLESLKGDRQQQLSRCSDTKPEPEIKALLKAFDRAISETEKRIRVCIRSNARIQQKSELLCSIPGVGERTASLLLAEVFLRTEFAGSKQVVAYAGLAPRIRQSGTSLRVKGGLSKVGSSRVRKSLFFPAIVAGARNPVLHDFAQRLGAKGKPKMSIVGALMRKLLVICYGVLKTERPFTAAITA